MNGLELFGTIAVSAISGVVALVVAIRTGKVELKKRKPETITHECRLIHTQVYTFIRGDKKQTPPLCAYIDPSNYISCCYNPKFQKDEGQIDVAQGIKEINDNQCYIALFNRKHDLI